MGRRFRRLKFAGLDEKYYLRVKSWQETQNLLPVPSVQPAERRIHHDRAFLRRTPIQSTDQGESNDLLRASGHVDDCLTGIVDDSKAVLVVHFEFLVSRL